jgi:3-deoxy-D-manno-octulosonate 8-phosphate phosphatase (KDO 8-P phosphatase)
MNFDAEKLGDKIKPVKLLVLDVDGVLTDGGIIYSESGEESKKFNSLDGAGIKYWLRAGHSAAIITGRSSPIVERRAAELGIDQVIMGAKDKLPALKTILDYKSISAEEAIYIGDDLPDIPPMRECGLSIAVSNATDEVKDFADFVTKRSGGNGAVREAIENILKKQGRWENILYRYFRH